MEDENEFFFFSLGGEDSAKNIYLNLLKDYSKYIQFEMELEDMLTDGVIDISVDKNGIFHYTPSKMAMESIKKEETVVKHMTFSDMLVQQGMSPHKYIEFKKVISGFHL